MNLIVLFSGLPTRRAAGLRLPKPRCFPPPVRAEPVEAGALPLARPSAQHACAEGGGRESPGGEFLSFASPKERNQRSRSGTPLTSRSEVMWRPKGDPTGCVPPLRSGEPAVLGQGAPPQNSLRCAAAPFGQPQRVSARSLCVLRHTGHPARCAPRRILKGTQPTRAIAALGPVFAGASATRCESGAERSDGPCGCSAAPPLLAAPAAGRLRGGTGVAAPVLRDLTRRGCPNGAATQRSEFRGAPRNRPAAGLPRSAAKGSQTGGRLLFGDFLLARQEKVTAPPGAHPGSRPQPRHTA